MNCNAIEPLLSQYIDGNLKDAQKKLVEAHLRTCAHCKAEMDMLALLVKDLKELPSRTPPAGFSQRVMSRIRLEEMKPASPWKRFFLPFHIKVPIQAIALVLVTFLATYLYRSNPVIQEDMTQLSSPESRIFREDSKVLKKNNASQNALRMEKDEAPSETMALQNTDKTLEKKRKSPETSFKQKEMLFVEAEKNREDLSQEPSLQRRSALSEKMMVIEEAIAPRKKDTLSTEEEAVFFLDASAERGIIRKKLEPLLQNMGGKYFKPGKTSSESKQEEASSEQILWIHLPPSHLDRFKTALASLGEVSESREKAEALQKQKKQIRTQLKKDLPPSLRIKVIIRSPSPKNHR
ncbi:MAG: anti-sigma factor family protein [Nitrospiria bacterium]